MVSQSRSEQINLKDHDILIATYTLQQEIIRRFDDYIKSNEEIHARTATEMNELSRNQIKTDGEILSLKGMVSNLDERVDKSESNNRWMSVAAIIGSIIAAALSILVLVAK